MINIIIIGQVSILQTLEYRRVVLNRKFFTDIRVMENNKAGNVENEGNGSFSMNPQKQKLSSLPSQGEAGFARDPYASPDKVPLSSQEQARRILQQRNTGPDEYGFTNDIGNSYSSRSLTLDIIASFISRFIR